MEHEMFKFGVSSFIWSENFSKNDLNLIKTAKNLGFEVIDLLISHPEDFPVKEVRDITKSIGIEPTTITVLNRETNLIDPDIKIRKAGIEFLKKLIDINTAIGSKVLGGVNYAAWGYLSGKPRTEDEWKMSIECMREVANYARHGSEVVIAVEPVNRFETHFLNIAEDAVEYCKEVGTDNIKVHLDSFHMIREELNFTKAVKTCGKEYLAYVHVCENNRGIPGTGLIPWKEFFSALKSIGYNGPMVIESFDPKFEELNRLCAIWRKFAETGEALAVEGRKNLKNIEKSLN
jgi:D-psicose/D-tagatose/L-ribulose 3-epimerase